MIYVLVTRSVPVHLLQIVQSPAQSPAKARHCQGSGTATHSPSYGVETRASSHMLRRVCLGMGVAGVIASGAVAQDLQKNQFKVIGLNSPTPVSIYYEVTSW